MLWGRGGRLGLMMGDGGMLGGEVEVLWDECRVPLAWFFFSNAFYRACLSLMFLESFSEYTSCEQHPLHITFTRSPHPQSSVQFDAVCLASSACWRGKWLGAGEFASSPANSPRQVPSLCRLDLAIPLKAQVASWVLEVLEEALQVSSAASGLPRGRPPHHRHHACRHTVREGHPSRACRRSFPSDDPSHGGTSSSHAWADRIQPSLSLIDPAHH